MATCWRSVWSSRSRLRLNAPHDLVGLVDQCIELRVGANAQMPKPLKELGQVLDRAVAKDFRLAVVGSREALGQMRNQFSQFARKGLFRKLHGLIETGLNAGGVLARKAPD